jgi:hypothetical protein
VPVYSMGMDVIGQDNVTCLGIRGGGGSWASPRFLRLSISIKRTELHTSLWIFERVVFATLRFQLLFVPDS